MMAVFICTELWPSESDGDREMLLVSVSPAIPNASIILFHFIFLTFFEIRRWRGAILAHRFSRHNPVILYTSQFPTLMVEGYISDYFKKIQRNQ